MRMVKDIKSTVVTALLWCLMAVLVVFGALNVSALRQYPSVSLRYKTPISGQAAYNARLYAARQSGDFVFWPTFWHETQAFFKNEYNSMTAVAILYSGDAALVWPARYLSGSAPGVTDGAGCAVSSALSRALWGGTDVVGKTVEADGDIRTVRGVFEGDEPLALLSVRDEDTSRNFSAVELTGGPSSPASSDAVSFAISAGLGSPDFILMGTATGLATVLALLPFLLLALYPIVFVILRLRTHPAVSRGILFLALMGFAIALPVLLGALPNRMIPTRWSDFSFWGAFAGQVGENLRQYLILEPKLRDVSYKVLFFRQVGVAFLSVVCALAVCFRWHFKRYAQ